MRLQWYTYAIGFGIGIAFALIVYFLLRRRKIGDFFMKLISSAENESSKRFIALVLVLNYIVSHYLLMYLKIQIANQKLVEQTLDGVEFMAIVFGGLIVGDKIVDFYKTKARASGAAEMRRAEMGVPENIVSQEVQNQNIRAGGNISVNPTTSTTTILAG